MLKYDLVENLLTPAPDDYMAQVTNVSSITETEIAGRMLRKGAGMTQSDILSVLQLYNEVIGETIAEGNAVNTPLFNAFPSISGVFIGAGDAFNPSRHKIKVNLNPGTGLREAMKKIKPERTQIAEPLPYIIEVKDVLSSTSNETLTPGGVIQIRGSRLKLFIENASNGLFLIDENGRETQCPVIIENKPARIIAMIPDTLGQGTYIVEVRTSYTTANRESKSIKTGRFHKELTV